MLLRLTVPSLNFVYGAATLLAIRLQPESLHALAISISMRSGLSIMSVALETESVTTMMPCSSCEQMRALARNMQQGQDQCMVRMPASLSGTPQQ